MSAYVVVEVEITDQATYDEYRKLVPATMEKYGGKILVRGGAVESIEGGWDPSRFVIIEFESMEQARTWYYSPEYTAAAAIRHTAANSKLFLIEGV